MADNMSPISLAIIIPTFNEIGNIVPLMEDIDLVLNKNFPNLAWEIVVVDDNSPDGTAEHVRQFAQKDRRLRLIHRIGRRGLSSAVVEGILASSADICVIMDGDRQHDPSYLPGLITPVLSDEADIVAASRFLDGGGAEGLSSEARRSGSLNAIKWVNRLFKMDMSDPLTGYFSIRRDIVRTEAPNLSQYGFKILIDLIVSADQPLRVKEVPFTFLSRQEGQSKLDNRIIFDFFLFLIERMVGRFVSLSPRFISFALVGGMGVFVHLCVMATLFALWAPGTDDTLRFGTAQFVGAFIAMFFNFCLNNLLTYRDKSLSGWAFIKGFLLFSALCSLGLVANVGVATAINNSLLTPWGLSALAGIIVGTVWNYAATRQFVWSSQ